MPTTKGIYYQCSSCLELYETMEEAEKCHMPASSENSAGVAQSAEQVPRKDEAVGSTPISSSTGLTDTQRTLFTDIIHHRLQVEENSLSARTSQEAMLAKTLEFNERMEALTKQRDNYLKQEEYHKEHLAFAEEKLKEAILNEAIVRPKSDPEPVVQEPEQEDLGRAE